MSSLGYPSRDEIKIRANMKYMAFRAMDYFITPRDLSKLLRSLMHISGRNLLKIFSLGIFCFVLKYFGISVENGLFVVGLLIVFLWNIDARLPIGSALAMLIAIILVLLVGPHTEFINETTWPEAMAVWVYFFLVIGVAKQIFDHARTRGVAGVEETHFQLPRLQPRLSVVSLPQIVAVRETSKVPSTKKVAVRHSAKSSLRGVTLRKPTKESVRFTLNHTHGNRTIVRLKENHE